MSSPFGRKRKSSDSSMHVSRNVRYRPAPTCSTPPTTSASISISSNSTPSPFDDKTDLFIEILLHTDKSNILYTRSAADLTERFKSVRLGFQQLSDHLLGKGVGGEKMDELMDVMEPARGAGITTVLSQDAFRPNTVMAMMQSLIQVGQDKFGSDFCQTALHLLFQSSPSSASTQAQPAPSSPSSTFTQASRPPSVSTQARPVHSRPSSVALQSPPSTRHDKQLPPSARHGRSSVTHKAGPSVNHEEWVMGQEMEKEEREDHPHRVFVNMSRRPQSEVRQQEHAILMAAKAQLGQHCGVEACGYLPRRGFALQVATRDQVDHIIGKEITVYEESIRLAPFRDDRPREGHFLSRDDERSRGDSWRPPRAPSLSTSHLSDEIPAEGPHHRLFSALVPLSVATSVRKNAVRAIANQFPSLKFSLQRQTFTRHSGERWILCFDGFVRSRKSNLRVEIGQGPAKPPFEAVFEAVWRSGGGCLVCRNDHKTTDCTFTTHFSVRYQLRSGQYLMKAPDVAGTRVDHPLR